MSAEKNTAFPKIAYFYMSTGCKKISRFIPEVWGSWQGQFSAARMVGDYCRIMYAPAEGEIEVKSLQKESLAG